MVLIFKIPHRWTACLQDGDIYELVQFVFDIDWNCTPNQWPPTNECIKKYSSKCWTMIHP